MDHIIAFRIPSITRVQHTCSRVQVQCKEASMRGSCSHHTRRVQRQLACRKLKLLSKLSREAGITRTVGRTTRAQSRLNHSQISITKPSDIVSPKNLSTSQRPQSIRITIISLKRPLTICLSSKIRNQTKPKQHPQATEPLNLPQLHTSTDHSSSTQEAQQHLACLMTKPLDHANSSQ